MSEAKDNNIRNDDLPLFNNEIKGSEIKKELEDKKNNVSEAAEQKMKKSEIVNRKAKSKPALGENTGRLGLTVGSYLQEARVKSDYSLSQVAMITKLNIHYIEAIERDDLKNAPPLIYVKAYIKKLCDLYGVDEDKALNLLEKENEKKKSNEKVLPDTVLQDLEETKQVDEKAAKKVVYFTRIIGASILLLIIIVVIICFSVGNSEQDIPNLPKDSQKTEKLINTKMEQLIVPQTFTSSELEIPEK